VKVSVGGGNVIDGVVAAVVVGTKVSVAVAAIAVWLAVADVDS
jgi:hypothetical protein